MSVIFPPEHGISRRPFLWAHRGVSCEAPENTMAAFRLAEGAGADGIECDVQLTRDGIPVLLHDDTIRRTSSGRGAVAEMSLAELRRFDFGGWFGRDFSGESIPTLENLLAWAGDRLWLNLELKQADTGRATLELLEEFRHAKVIISSFDWEVLATVRSYSPDLPLAVLVDRRPWQAALEMVRSLGAVSLNPSVRRVTRPLLAACRAEGVPLIPYTVNDPDRFLALVGRGVGGVFTNDPRLLRGVVLPV